MSCGVVAGVDGRGGGGRRDGGLVVRGGVEESVWEVSV